MSIFSGGQVAKDDLSCVGQFHLLLERSGLLQVLTIILNHLHIFDFLSELRYLAHEEVWDLADHVAPTVRFVGLEHLAESRQSAVRDERRHLELEVSQVQNVSVVSVMVANFDLDLVDPHVAEEARELGLQGRLSLKDFRPTGQLVRKAGRTVFRGHLRVAFMHRNFRLTHFEGQVITSFDLVCWRQSLLLHLHAHY